MPRETERLIIRHRLRALIGAPPLVSSLSLERGPHETGNSMTGCMAALVTVNDEPSELRIILAARRLIVLRREKNVGRRIIYGGEFRARISVRAS